MKCSDAKMKLPEFERLLKKEDKAETTIKKYVNDIRIFLLWCDSKFITKITLSVLQNYRKDLISRRKVSGCNSVIISLNMFFKIYAKKENLYIKIFKIQRKGSLDSIFSMEDYKKLLYKALEMGNKRLYCIMRTLASSGIRISELAYITVESLFTGVCSVVNKGRAREIFIPCDVCRLLMEYCKEVGIKKGIVFCAPKNPNKMMDKSQIWKQMNMLGKLLNFPKGYVHAHSFRHFFAKQYIFQYKDVCELADILGHSSIETTRIYTRTTMSEKKNRIEALQL